MKEEIVWNGIQLKPFDVKEGERFLVQLSNGDVYSAVWKDNAFRNREGNVFHCVVAWTRFKGVDVNTLKVHRLIEYVRERYNGWNEFNGEGKHFRDDIISMIENEFLKGE